MLDGGNQLFGAPRELIGRLAPLADGFLPQRRVAIHEVFRGLQKFGTETFETLVEFREPGIRNEAGDTPQKWEAGTLNDGMGTRLDQREIGKRVLCDQSFLAEMDKPFRDLCRIQSEIFGPEAFAASPEFDRN